MGKSSKSICILFSLAFILSLNLASSQVLVAGKIYNGGFSDVISGASISVVCNSHTLNTESLVDGTYAVRFDETECSEGNSASVSASKSGFQGKTGSGTISVCDGADCDEDYVTIVNLGMETAPASTGGTGGGGGGGGSGGGGFSVRYFMCGNGKCDTGETIKTCAKDCNKTAELQVANPTETITDQPTEAERIGEEEKEQIPEESEALGSKILGAVIGAGGKMGKWGILAFIIIIITLIFIIGLIRKGRGF